MKVCLKLHRSLISANTDVNVHPTGAQQLDASARNTCIGVGECHNHPGHPGIGNGLGTWWGHPMVGTRLKGAVQRGPHGSGTGIGQRHHLGMGT